MGKEKEMGSSKTASPAELKTDISYLVNHHKTNLKLTNQQIAEMVGYTRQGLRVALNGGNCRIEFIEKLSDAFGYNFFEGLALQYREGKNLKILAEVREPSETKAYDTLYISCLEEKLVLVNQLRKVELENERMRNLLEKNDIPLPS